MFYEKLCVLGIHILWFMALYIFITTVKDMYMKPFTWKHCIDLSASSAVFGPCPQAGSECLSFDCNEDISQSLSSALDNIKAVNLDP